MHSLLLGEEAMGEAHSLKLAAPKLASLLCTRYVCSAAAELDPQSTAGLKFGGVDGVGG